MLRKILIGAIVANFAFILVSVLVPSGIQLPDLAVAAQNTSSFGVKASIAASSAFDTFLYELVGNDIVWNDLGDTMEFGELTDNGFGHLTSKKTYAVVMIPATQGQPYTITATGGPLTVDPKGSIGAGEDNQTNSTEDAYLLVPDYQWQDRFDPDVNISQGHPGGTVGQVARLGKANNHEVFKSDTGFSRIIRSYVGITGVPEPGVVISSNSLGYDGSTAMGVDQPFVPGDAFDAITKDQPAGTYSGDVVFTLTY